jgi:general secretion pathway protein J
MRLDVLTSRTARRDGFTLFEALVAVALMGLILSILATVIAQWTPSWKAGFARTQRAELVGLALDRIVADLASAQYITPVGGEQPLFNGSSSSATFVRSTIGPNAAGAEAKGKGIEIVRLFDSADEGGLVRARTPYSPAASNAFSDDFKFSDAILLLRAPLRASFSFAGRDRIWKDAWSDAPTLPAAVRITISNEETNEILTVSTATLLHVNAPAACVSADATQCAKHIEKGDAAKPAEGAGL